MAFAGTTAVTELWAKCKAAFSAASHTHSNASASTSGTGGSAGFISAADQEKLDGIAAGAQVNSVTGVKGDSEVSYRTGNVNVTCANIGAATASDMSTAQQAIADVQAAIDTKLFFSSSFDDTSSTSAYEDSVPCVVVNTTTSTAYLLVDDGQ